MSYQKEQKTRFKRHDYGRSQPSDARPQYTTGRDYAPQNYSKKTRTCNLTNSRCEENFDFKKKFETKNNSYQKRAHHRRGYSASDGFGKDLTLKFDREKNTKKYEKNYEKNYERKYPDFEAERKYESKLNNRKPKEDARSPTPNVYEPKKSKMQIGVRRGFNRHLYGANPKELSKKTPKNPKQNSSSKPPEKPRDYTPRAAQYRSGEKQKVDRYMPKYDIKAKTENTEKQDAEGYKNYDDYKARQVAKKNKKDYGNFECTRDLRLANLRARRREEPTSYTRKFAKGRLGGEEPRYRQQEKKEYPREYQRENIESKKYDRKELDSKKYERRDYDAKKYDRGDYDAKKYERGDYDAKKYERRDLESKSDKKEFEPSVRFEKTNYDWKRETDYPRKDQENSEFKRRDYQPKNLEFKTKLETFEKPGYDQKEKENNNERDRSQKYRRNSKIDQLHEEWKRRREEKRKVLDTEYRVDTSKDWRRNYPNQAQTQDLSARRIPMDRSRSQRRLPSQNYKKPEKEEETPYTPNRKEYRSRDDKDCRRIDRNRLGRTRNTKSQIQIGRNTELKLDLDQIKSGSKKTYTPRAGRSMTKKGHTYGYNGQKKEGDEVKTSKIFDAEKRELSKERERSPYLQNRVEYPHLKHSRKLRKRPEEKECKWDYENRNQDFENYRKFEKRESVKKLSDFQNFGRYEKNESYKKFEKNFEKKNLSKINESSSRKIRGFNNHLYGYGHTPAKEVPVVKKQESFRYIKTEERTTVTFNKIEKVEEERQIFNFKKGSFRDVKKSSQKNIDPSIFCEKIKEVKEEKEASSFHTQRPTFSAEGFFQPTPNYSNEMNVIAGLRTNKKKKSEREVLNSSFLKDSKNSQSNTCFVDKNLTEFGMLGDEKLRASKNSRFSKKNQENSNFFSNFSFQNNRKKYGSKSFKATFDTAKPTKKALNFQTRNSKKDEKIKKKSSFEFFSIDSKFRTCKFMKKTKFIGICDNEADGVQKSKMINWRSKKVLTSQKFDISK